MPEDKKIYLIGFFNDSEAKSAITEIEPLTDNIHVEYFKDGQYHTAEIIDGKYFLVDGERFEIPFKEEVEEVMQGDEGSAFPIDLRWQK